MDGTSASCHGTEERDLVARRKCPATVDVRPPDDGERRTQCRRELRVGHCEAVVQVLDRGAIGELEPEHRSRRESRDAAAETNANLHGALMMLTRPLGCDVRRVLTGDAKTSLGATLPGEHVGALTDLLE
jgi:hypothetical protein